MLTEKGLFVFKKNFPTESSLLLSWQMLGIRKIDLTLGVFR